MKTLLLSMVFCCFVLQVFPGNRYTEPSPWNKVGQSEGGEWNVRIRSIGFDGMIYNPSLSFWRQEYMTKNWDQQFQSMPMLGGNIEVGLTRHFSLRVEGHYGTTETKESKIPDELGGGSQSKTLDMLPLSGIIIYELNSDFLVVPYVGAGGGMILVNSINERKGSSSNMYSKSSSGDYLGYAVGGIRYPATGHLFIGAEVRGVLGSYAENVTDTHQVVKLQRISLTGVQVMVSLNYRFGRQ